MSIKSIIIRNTAKFQGVVWGVAGLEGTSFASQYLSVVVLVIPFEEMLTPEKYTEPYFREIQYRTFPVRNALEAAIAQELQQAGINHHVVALPNLEETLQAELSVKEAARRAGLGWIGKNGLLITRQYGPRISLSGILVNEKLAVGMPENESGCGECSLCVKGCTFQTLSGKNWTPEMSTGDLVDYQSCHDQRNRFKKSGLGRKLSCGKCIVACPWGIRP